MPNMELGVKPAGPISELFIFVSEDPEGNQSIASYVHPTAGVVLMITGARDVLEPFKSRAESMIRGTGHKMHVVHFTAGETLETFVDPASLDEREPADRAMPQNR